MRPDRIGRAAQVPSDPRERHVPGLRDALSLLIAHRLEEPDPGTVSVPKEEEEQEGRQDEHRHHRRQPTSITPPTASPPVLRRDVTTSPITTPTAGGMFASATRDRISATPDSIHDTSSTA